MNTGPGAVDAAAPGPTQGRAQETSIDVRFECGPANALVAIDRAGGCAWIATTADPGQRAALLAPRPVPAKAGGAGLYLDGWSTLVEVVLRRAADASEPARAGRLTVGAWFAPGAFARGDARGFTAVVDASAPAGQPASAPATGFALGHDRTGRLAVDVAGRLVVADARLAPGNWHHLAMVAGAGHGELRLDGRTVAEFEADAAALALPDRIVLGRTRAGARVEGLFPVAAAIGVLGPVRVAHGVEEPVVPSGADGFGPAEVVPDRARYDTDPHHPIAHLSAPQGWMNEPHAAVHAGGIHHVFFQQNPAGPYWGHIAWGHATSRDLVHWHDAGLAVTPGASAVAPDGIWSGSSVIDPAGEHLLFVTAGDFGRTPDQSIAVARQMGDVGWATDASPLLEMPRTVPGRSEPLIRGQFRDPFVWREDEDWFMVVGAGLEGQGGAALLFHSADGDHWIQQEPLHVGDVGRFPATGVMWELPVLLSAGTGADGVRRHVLFVAPWWSGPSEHHLQHVWHWIGVWDAAARRFTPDHDEPREFDGGGHLTGPSGTVLDDGRAILWTIAQDTRSLAEFAASGWAHNAGLPLELGLHDDGTLLVRPVAEVALLRERRIEPRVEPAGEAAYGAAGSAAVTTLLLSGRHLDLEIDVEGQGFRIEVLRSEDGSETTVLGVDGPEVWIDRSRSSLDPAHVETRRRAIRRSDATRAHARLVVDGSMIELYVDDRVSLTSRAYPLGRDAVDVRLQVPAEARLLRFSAHELHPAYEPRPRPRKADPTC
ncbi:GH32 C-terminal domain-containing protein [Agromyces sp. ZXT2-6]|uniref:GH32 C-terminal domain-containing protein n=1 Tax=Agromyces sp. ZXT2-6 TaxID=3461153 RepID=UPI004054A169